MARLVRKSFVSSGLNNLETSNNRLSVADGVVLRRPEPSRRAEFDFAAARASSFGERRPLRPPNSAMQARLARSTRRTEIGRSNLEPRPSPADCAREQLHQAVPMRDHVLDGAAHFRPLRIGERVRFGIGLPLVVSTKALELLASPIKILVRELDDFD